MSERHTAGPWLATNEHHGPTVWRIESTSADYVNEGWVIADFHGPDGEANARLSAAAPELLNLMRQLLRITPHRSLDTCAPLYRMMAEVVSKATPTPTEKGEK